MPLIQVKIIIIYDELITITRQYGCGGRESAKLINSLYNSLPEKAKQYLMLLRVVESLYTFRGVFIIYVNW